MGRVIGDKKQSNEPVAYIERIADDQGGGGALCSNCKTCLALGPEKEPEKCPKCGRKLIDSRGPPFVNIGGSDF